MRQVASIRDQRKPRIHRAKMFFERNPYRLVWTRSPPHHCPHYRCIDTGHDLHVLAPTRKSIDQQQKQNSSRAINRRLLDIEIISPRRSIEESWFFHRVNICLSISNFRVSFHFLFFLIWKRIMFFTNYNNRIIERDSKMHNNKKKKIDRIMYHHVNRLFSRGW